MRNINVYKILWLLPIIFLIHNIEEIAGFQKWVDHMVSNHRFAFLNQLYRIENVIIAMVLLTSVVTIVIWIEYRQRSSLTFHLAYLCICLLLANGFTHVGQLFLYKKDYVPGLVSATLLVIPYASYMSYLFIENEYIHLKKAIKYFIISIIAMGPIIMLFLLISELFVILIRGLTEIIKNV